VIPVTRADNKLRVAMSEPLNLVVRDQIEIRTGCKVVPVAATSNAIRQAVRYHFNVQNATRQAIASMQLKQGSDELNRTEPDDKSPQAMVDRYDCGLPRRPSEIQITRKQPLRHAFAYLTNRKR